MVPISNMISDLIIDLIIDRIYWSLVIDFVKSEYILMKFGIYR